jgi:putative tryptophan/tyrosine transport system substrate-binding protein
VIVTSNNPLVLRFKSLVQSIPIVAFMGDPVTSGIVSSLARPGGNITGITADAGSEIWGKRLEMLVEVAPKTSRVGFLCSEAFWDGAQGAMVREVARQASVMLVVPPLHGVYQEPECLRVFDALQRQNAEVLLVSDSTENLVKRHLIVDLAEKARLPTLYPFREFVDIGGLIAYAVDNRDILRRGADYVDLVLKGTKPGEIPIYQADKFATIVNLKTAKALGLQLPPAVLASADAVIE